MDENIVELIHNRYMGMTAKQRKLSNFMLENTDAMCFMTLKELATSVSITEMTVLNACRMLGLENYNDLKYEFRKYSTENTRNIVQVENLYTNPPVPTYELSDKARLLDDICNEEYATTEKFIAQLKKQDLFKGADMIINASNTIICARGVSMQIAEFLAMRLATMGMPSMVVNTEMTDSIQAALPLMKKGVLVLPIALPDYYTMTVKICEFAKQRHASILCITDNLTQSPIAKYGDLVLTAPCNTRLFLSTPAPVMMLANLLSSALNIEKSSMKSNKFTTPNEFAKLF